jgi:3-phenylpropionate/cinnamic acid dioxygenase small subunit
MTSTTDHDKIRRLLAEYCLACDECRFDDFASLFGEDGVVQAFRRDWVGHDTLVGFISNAPEGIHINSAIRIDLDGDRAEVLSNFVFFTLDNHVGSMGTYADVVVRAEDNWRFARREIRLAKPKNPTSDTTS